MIAGSSRTRRMKDSGVPWLGQVPSTGKSCAESASIAGVKIAERPAGADSLSVAS